MTGNAKFWVVLTALLIYSHSAFGSEDAGLNGPDAFWAEAANTVIEGDFEGYKETYHEERNDSYVHFEALLIRQDGWKVMMEYQKSPATQDEWDAAR